MFFQVGILLAKVLGNMITMGLKVAIPGSFAAHTDDHKTKLWGGDGKSLESSAVAVIEYSMQENSSIKTHTTKGGSTHVSQQRCQTDPEE